ncbi:atrophin-1-like, partial [Solea solea]|uniref:atrophin-1-like n=1 Tax=Solea solea TaxID=90069 RepID=UPI00272D8D1F
PSAAVRTSIWNTPGPVTCRIRSADPNPSPRPRGSPLDWAKADAAASPSPTPVNPPELQMDSPITHHINGNGSNGTGTLLFPNLPAPELQSADGGSSSPSLSDFGTPWSVQTSSSPPPPAPSSIHAINHHMPVTTDSDSGFYPPGLPSSSSINPAFFHSFSAVSANPCAGINVVQQHHHHHQQQQHSSRTAGLQSVRRFTHSIRARFCSRGTTTTNTR